MSIKTALVTTLATLYPLAAQSLVVREAYALTDCGGEVTLRIKFTIRKELQLALASLRQQDGASGGKLMTVYDPLESHQAETCFAPSTGNPDVIARLFFRVENEPRKILIRRVVRLDGRPVLYLEPEP